MHFVGGKEYEGYLFAKAASAFADGRRWGSPMFFAAPSLARAHLSPIAAEFKPAHAIDEPLEGVPLVRFGDF